MPLSNQQIIEIARTGFPAAERFREIDAAYQKQGLQTPISVEHGWQKFKRVMQYAVKDQQYWVS